MSMADSDDAGYVMGTFFIGIYVMMFAAILFFHELSQMMPLGMVERLLRSNFGFLFKPIGKGLFIIFIAFLNFGLGGTNNLGLATGICLCVVGALYIVMFLRNPEYFEESKQLPSGGQPPYGPPPGGMPPQGV